MIKFGLVLLLGFYCGYASGPYITPIKAERIVNKSLHSTPKVDKMSFESRVKRTE